MELFPPGSTHASLPQRDKIAIISGLAGTSAVAWAYLFYLSASIEEMNMSAPGSLMHLHPWSPMDFVFMILMWAIMMVGMMLPSATPMTLLYAGVARKAERQGTPIAPTAVFVSGYLMVWALFSVGATGIQWGFHQAALLSPMMATNSELLGAILLIVAGIYQFTPLKNVCLDHCRSPAHFISQHWRMGISGALRMGLEHGAYCLGCCWALMGLLFFGGVMNLLWIAGIALFVFLEKVWPFGLWSGRVAGGGMTLLGIAAFVTWLTGST